MSEVDDYIASVPADQAEEFSRLRRLIHAAAPNLTECKSYGMPSFKYRDKYLVSFFAFKDHLSIFPGADAIAAYQTELAGFVTAKGTVQFTLDHPIPDALVIAIVKHRAAAIDAAATDR